MFKIGVMLESFRLNLDESIESAKRLGVDGIQLYATGGETHYQKLQGGALETLRHKLCDADLEVAAVCGDFGGHGFEVADDNPHRIDETKRVIDLASELGTRVVTTHIGVIPADHDHPRRAVMLAACQAIGSYAASVGITVAIETGPEPATVLCQFIEDLGKAAGIGVNFDPANLVMVCQEDIPIAVTTLAPYIVHTHAKDGRNLKPVDPHELYSSFAGRPPYQGYDANAYILETPLGEGDVPFPVYLKQLVDCGLSDLYLTIEREVGEDPYGDISKAVNFLRLQQYDVDGK